MHNWARLVVAVGLSVGAAATVSADVPQLMNYQGILQDAGGSAITAPTNVLFAVWDAPMGGDSLWSEVRTVSPDLAGRFNVLLGQVSPIPVSAFVGDAYLSLKVEADPEMSPRQQFVSVAFAYRVGTIDEATGGSISGDVVLWDNLNVEMDLSVVGNVGIGTTSPGSELEVAGNVEAGGFTIGGVPVGTSTDSYWSESDSGIFFGSGNVGIGTVSPQNLLDIQQAGSGSTAPGVKVKGYANDQFPGAYLLLGKSRAPFVGMDWMTFPGDTLGVVDGFGISPLGTEGVAARMTILQVGESPDSLVPGAILFSTCDGDSGVREHMRIDASGDVGIGTPSPVAKLDVEGDVHASGSITVGSSITIDGGNDMITATSGAIDFNDEDLYTTGRVGIGTSTPGTRQLKVVGDIEVTGKYHGDGSALTGIAGDNLGDHTATQNLKLNGKYLSGDGQNEGVYVDNDGDVGIGTTSPGIRKLKVAGDVEATGTYYGDGSGLSGIAGDNLGDHTATQNIKLGGNYLSGDGGAEGVYVRNDGNVGIGTSTPDHDLDVIGAVAIDQFLYHRNDLDTYLDFSNDKLDVHAGGVQMLTATEAVGGDALVINEGGLDVDFRIESDTVASAFFVRGSDGKVGIGTNVPQAELAVWGSIMATEDVNVSGTTVTGVLEITGGTDLAEPFVMSNGAPLLPGMVAVIDDRNPGTLRMSDRAYDKRVAGVVSGAGGVNAGLTLTQHGVFDSGQNVALTGRVYCLADAATGSITPGDFLTTSPTPGYAMKVSDYDKAQGAVIGKAMTPLEEGQGLVLVLVSLQ